MEALEKLEIILSDYGLSETDINCLLAQFLEEEAQLYIEATSLVNNENIVRMTHDVVIVDCF